MKLEIHSFKSIQKKALLPFAPHTALISIGDPDAPSPKLLYKPEYILRLVFDDITPEEVVERLELPPDILNQPEMLRNLLANFNTFLFTDEMAEKTAGFIMERAEKTNVLICQCEYGQSRSAAVAAAVAEFYGGHGDVILRDNRYCPNTLVYRKLLAALQGR